MLKNKNQDSWSGNMELTSILHRAWQAVGAFLQRNTYLILQHLPCSTDKIPGILRKIGTSSVCNSQCAENAIFTNGKAGLIWAAFKASSESCPVVCSGKCRIKGSSARRERSSFGYVL